MSSLAAVVRAAGHGCRCLGVGCRRCRRRTSRAFKRELKRGNEVAANYIGASIATHGRVYELGGDGSLRRRVDPAPQQGGAE